LPDLLVEPLPQLRLLSRVALDAATKQIAGSGHQPLLPLDNLARMNFKMPSRFVERPLPFDGFQSHFRLEDSAVFLTWSFHIFLLMVLLLLLTHHLNHLSSFPGAL
jgi:hypothetical protein